MTAPDLSIIIAQAPGTGAADDVILAVTRACSGVRTEILLVGGAAPRPPSRATENVRQVPATAGSLVPVLWGRGIEQASAPVVGLLSTEFIPDAEWVRTLVPLLEGPVAGVAGALAPEAHAPRATTAMYLLRFSPFLPAPENAVEEVRNIPGDGAFYRRQLIDEHRDLLVEGFWEVEFHRRWLAAGQRLLLSRRPLVRYRGGASLGECMRLRFRHGRQYGAAMVLRKRSSPWRHILGAPLVPMVLISRVARRAARIPGGGRLLTRSFPSLAALTIAWSAGEAVGAASPLSGQT